MTEHPNQPPKGTALASRMGRAVLWTMLNSFVLRLAQFLVGVVVARLVVPEQFGVFAVALTVHAIVMNVSELGASAALVRAKDGLQRIAPTVFTIALLSSGALTAAMYFSANRLAVVLGAPAAGPAIRILSFTVLLGGLTAVPYALLVRSFRQDKRFFADLANFVVSTVAIVLLAINGYGAEGLAWSKLGGQLISWIMLVVMITPRFRPGWNRLEAKAILRFSLPLAGASVVAFALSNVDYIVVGRELGPLLLGLYTLAYNVAGWPVSVFGLLINEIALPAFAQVRDEKKDLPERLASVCALTAAIVLPVSILCLTLAHSLIVSVYGVRWVAAASVLAVLGIFGSMRILLTVFTNFLIAVGHSRGVLAIQICWIAVLVPALVVGVHWDGIVGAGIAQQVVATLVVLPLALFLVSRNGGGRIMNLLRACQIPILGTACLSVWMFAFLRFSHPGWGQLLIGGTSGGLIYAALVGKWLYRNVRESRKLWNRAVA